MTSCLYTEYTHRLTINLQMSVIVLTILLLFVAVIAQVDEVDKTEHPAVRCIGTFVNGNLKLSLPKSKRRLIMVIDDIPLRISDRCFSLEVLIENETEVNWTKTEKMLLPNLKFFSVNLRTKDQTSPSEYISRVGWKNILFFDKDESDSESVDSTESINVIWKQGVEFVIIINEIKVLHFDPNPGFKFLHIDSIEDPDPILATLENGAFFLETLILFNCKLKQLDSISPNKISFLKLRNAEYEATSEFVRKCKSLKELDLGFLNLEIGYFDLADVLTSKNISAVSITNATVTFTKPTDEIDSLNYLYLRGCQYESASFEENAWSSLPKLTHLAIVPGPNGIRPNPEFLESVLEDLENIKWIHLTNFDWSPLYQSQLRNMSKFLRETKGDLKGIEPNFILKRIHSNLNSNSKWRGWKYIGNEEAMYDFTLLSQLDQPQESYKAKSIEISLSGSGTAKLSKNSVQFSNYIQEMELEKLFLCDNRPLSLNESLKNSRNISLVVDGNVLLKLEFRITGEKEMIVSHLNVNTILKNIKGLAKLELRHVNIDDFGQLQSQCANLEKLELTEVSFREDDIDMGTIAGECGDLRELTLKSEDSVRFELNLNGHLKSKNLQKLMLFGAKISLTPKMLVPYPTLEELYLMDVDIQNSFLENFWKVFPNLKRIGMGSANPIILKSIITNLKQIEWIYFRTFEWSSIKEDVDFEMERFVFLTEGDLLGSEDSSFLLEKIITGKWKGMKCDLYTDILL